MKTITVFWYCLGCGKSGQVTLAVHFAGPVPSLEEQISYLAAARHEAELSHSHEFSDLKILDPMDSLAAGGLDPGPQRGKNWVN